MAFPEELYKHLSVRTPCMMSFLSARHDCPYCGSSECWETPGCPIEGEEKELPIDRQPQPNSLRRCCNTVFITIAGQKYVACVLFKTHGIRLYSHAAGAAHCDNCGASFRMNRLMLAIPEPYISEFATFGCIALALKKRKKKREIRNGFHS